MNNIDNNPSWMRWTLIAAGGYNLMWGASVVLLPAALFRWAEMELPRYPQIWQCVGMIVGVYGIGYLIAAGNPLRHWPIVLVGLLGKIFGPIGFLTAAFRGDLPWSWGATIISNDLIWWLPFGLILYRALCLSWRGEPAPRLIALQTATTGVEGRLATTSLGDRAKNIQTVQ